MDEFEPTAAARLIEARRGDQRLSVRKAAMTAGISEGRWRQVAKGYQAAAGGARLPVNVRPDTLARMAAAVGLTSADLRSLGEREAADELDAAQHPAPVGVVLHAERYHRAVALLDAWLRDDASHPPTDALWAFTPGQLARVLAEQVDVLEHLHLQADRDALGSTPREVGEGDGQQPAAMNPVSAPGAPMLESGLPTAGSQRPPLDTDQ